MVGTLDLSKAEEKKDDETPWPVSAMSQKACRTENPIRKIVDPIVKNIQSGMERGDGKDHISLAVSAPRDCAVFAVCILLAISLLPFCFLSPS